MQKNWQGRGTVLKNRCIHANSHSGNQGIYSSKKAIISATQYNSASVALRLKDISMYKVRTHKQNTNQYHLILIPPHYYFHGDDMGNAL